MPAPQPTIGNTQLKLLEKLCNACAVSGDEGEVRKIVLEEVKPYADEVKVDVLGNVLATKNEALERANKDLLAANAKLAQQLETAYQKVQGIAEKTVEGTSQARCVAELQRLLLEQARKTAGEKQ